MKYLLPLGFVILIVIHGCSEVVPGSCYPDPAGGTGGAGSMAVGVGAGAGVGAGSGDFISPPPNDPLDYSGDSNPCAPPQNGGAVARGNRVGPVAGAVVMYEAMRQRREPAAPLKSPAPTKPRKGLGS